MDDYADEKKFSADQRKKALDQVSEWAAGSFQAAHPFWRKLDIAIETYQIPRERFSGIIEGVRSDFHDGKSQYVVQTWQELEDYCQAVAGDVGYIVLCLLSAQTPEADFYSRHQGRCVQYLNIMRDIQKDLDERRCFVPLEFLKQLNAFQNEDDIFKRRFSPSTSQKIRNELFFRAHQSKELARPYSKKCFLAQLMVNFYFKAAKKYWLHGKQKRLGSFEKKTTLARLAIQECWKLRKLAS